MKDIYEYPVDQRPRVAVARFRRIQGDFIFEKLLDYLGYSYDEFVKEYGEKLLADPTCLSHEVVEMMTSRIRKTRRHIKCSN